MGDISVLFHGDCDPSLSAAEEFLLRVREGQAPSALSFKGRQRRSGHEWGQGSQGHGDRCPGMQIRSVARAEAGRRSRGPQGLGSADGRVPIPELSLVCC